MTEAYGRYTYNDPNFIKRSLHRGRFNKALKILNLKKEEKFLDYGCGDGHFLSLLNTDSRAENLFGFEPATQMLDQARKNLSQTRITVVQSLDELLGHKFDKISSLDTCEHLNEEDLKILFNNIKTFLEKEGFFLISVPIEIGPASLFKNIYRLISRQKYDDLTFKNTLKSLFGLKIIRRASQIEKGVDYYFSHIGFNHRRFEKKLKEYFIIVERISAPISILGPFFNNTLYYLCQKR